MPAHQFRNDRPDDFLHILHEVGQWLVDSGREMWEIRTLTLDNLVDEYTEDNCYVLYASAPDGAAVPAATFILQWEDPLYYPDVPPNTVGIIHKVAIRRAFAGQHLFQTILDFCQAECLKRGIHEIQLETDATRPALMQFYERHGFEPTYQRTIHEFGQTFVCQYYRLLF
ncbi:GNAT family N-acetyltransferase [Spirosoma rigui]|uniref:GNAT family N-acetyltransferase n=1 Tax=Spirosoma rigui TaxID=564064 RepID=UPI0009B15C3D|nr:GNAT family N-acetyltransferase [Spirosoma rigui]